MEETHPTERSQEGIPLAQILHRGKEAAIKR